MRAVSSRAAKICFTDVSLRAYRVGRLIVRLTNDGEYTFSSVNTLNLTRLNVVSEMTSTRCCVMQLRNVPACPPR